MKIFGIVAFAIAVTAAVPAASAAETCTHPPQGVVQDGVLRLQCGKDLIPVVGIKYQTLKASPVWICERHRENNMTEWLVGCHPPLGYREARR